MRKRETILGYNCYSYHIDSIINLKKAVKINYQPFLEWHLQNTLLLVYL